MQNTTLSSEDSKQFVSKTGSLRLGLSSHTGAELDVGASRDETPFAEGGRRERGDDVPLRRSDRPRTLRTIDSALLARAREAIGNIEEADALEVQLLLTSLASDVKEMWVTAVDASEQHQDVLAILESGVLSCARDGVFDRDQLIAIREALSTLTQPTVVREAVEVVREEFHHAGFPALPFLENT